MSNRFLLAALIFACFQGRILANGFSLSDQDAFATARGGAFVATADNASAIYYNPAGITQLENNNLQGGVYGIYLDPTYSPPNGAPNAGTTYHNADNWAAVPQGFYTHKFKNSLLSLGLGIYAPFGGNIDWPQDTGFRSVATQGKLTYYTINPVAALKLAPSLSVGAGLTINHVKMDLEQGLQTIYLAPNINFYRFTGDGWSVGYNLGALWKPIKQLSFGVSFHSSATVNLAGHSDFEEFSAGVPYTTSPAHVNFAFPLEGVGGISYRPTSKWNLELDASYTAWSSFGKTTIYQSGAFLPGEPQNIPVTLDWQDSWMCEFGVTRYFNKGWQVSAGYTFDQNSVPDAYYTPLAADMDRHFFSIGVGRTSKLFDFNLAYQFGYGPDNSVIGSTPPTPIGKSAGPHPADGTYRFISSALMLTVGVHF